MIIYSRHDFAFGISMYEKYSEEILQAMIRHEKQDVTKPVTIEVQALGAHSLLTVLRQLFRIGTDDDISNSSRWKLFW